MNLMQDLVNEINMLKQFQEKREDEFQTVMKDFLLDQPNEIQKQRGELDDQRMKLATMHQALDNLDEKLSQYPPPNEVNNMVRWEILQDTLLTADKRKKLKPKEDIGAEPEDASRSSKTSLPSTRKIQPSSSSQALQAKPHKAKGAQHPSKGAPAKHVAQQSPRQAAQQPASADQAGPGAQQLVTGAQEFPTETPTGPGAQQVPTGAPAGPEASPSATGLQFGPESQQADTGIPGGPGAQQLPMGIPFGPEAQQFPMGIPSGPGAPQVPMGIPYGPGAPQVPMGIPYGPGALQVPMGIPYGPGAPQVPMGIPYEPGAPQVPMGIPYGPGAQQFPMGFPYGPGAQQFPMGFPYGPGAQQFPMGFPYGPGTQQPVGPVDQQFDIGTIIEPEAQPTGPGSLSSVGSPGGPGTPVFAPAGLGTLSPTMEIHEGMPCFYEVEPQIQEGGRPSSETKPPPGSPAPSSLHSKIKSAETVTASSPSSRLSSATVRFMETVDALRQIGQVAKLYGNLKEQVDDLYMIKADRSELFRLPALQGMQSLQGLQGMQNLQGLQELPGFQGLQLSEADIPRLTSDVLEQLASLKDLKEDLQENKQMLLRLQSIIDQLLTQFSAEADPKLEGVSQMRLQISSLSLTVQKIEKELKELREKQEQGKVKIEQSVNESAMNLQEQLDKLGSILQNMMSSSSALLAMSIHDEKPIKPDSKQKPKPQHSEATCPACCIDLSEQVSRLVTRYEHLQELVDNIMGKQKDGKAPRKLHLKVKDGELQKHCQEVILQLQDECEKLNSTTRNLIEDHNEKQKQIDLLYQSLEKLDEKKADKEQMELDFDSRATKNALESKVSRSQFDATAEQLNVMIQDLLNKVTGQEQDWHKVVDKISFEMENKLDRMELDPFRKLLEDRWKSIRKQLKERSPTYDLDDAAGIRKQLIARFHCISCDRPVDMAVPGPPILTIPNIPGLPGHRSNRPYTVYELEQVRQHSRNMKSGITYARYEAVQMEKSINQLRRLHTCLRKEIEKVQAHFGGSMRASTQTIKEMLQSRCLNLGQHRKRLDSKTIVDRVPEVMMDQSAYLSNRSCGGSHTLTFPHRRYTRLQNVTQYSLPGEEENIPSVVKGEVDILGMDGQIYKGRLDPRFPPIGGKETMQPKNKAKPQTPPKALTPIDPNSLSSRSQSAKMACRSPSSTGLGKNGKDRPTGSQLIDNLEVRIDVPIHRISSEETALS
nr:glutamine-rich protein 2 isoform X2 [Geotrypetes seraphini]